MRDDPRPHHHEGIAHKVRSYNNHTTPQERTLCAMALAHITANAFAHRVRSYGQAAIA